MALRWGSKPKPTCALPPALRALAEPAALRIASKNADDAFDNSLLAMAAELNAPRAADGGADADGWLLVAMVHRLRVLLDVYMATEGSGSGATAVCGALAPRRHRGRDRRKPFVFDGSTGQFDQSH